MRYRSILIYIKYRKTEMLRQAPSLHPVAGLLLSRALDVVDRTLYELARNCDIEATCRPSLNRRILLALSGKSGKKSENA